MKRTVLVAFKSKIGFPIIGSLLLVRKIQKQQMLLNLFTRKQKTFIEDNCSS